MKKTLTLLTVLLLAFLYFQREQSAKEDTPVMDAKAAIVLDAETNKILYEMNSQEAMPIASMSKMMTQYIVLDAIKNGDIQWDTLYQPSAAVFQKTAQPELVTLGMSSSSTYTVNELFTAMTVISANDAAIALAEVVSGSEEAFVEVMNVQAEKFGLQSAHFINATGLDAGETNVASARDVAVLARRLIEDHPEVLDYTKMTDFTTSEGIRRWNTNAMLPGMPMAMKGMDGLKTGYTEEAGSCFASTGVFDGRRIITVVMGAAEDRNQTNPSRFEVTRQLLDEYALN
ncbi:D-alanyl-D-alanine carboxypeptidase family protein [Sporosarcina sp. Te-1]|uniref:D-alanyl-D-alanine carboxypeptidase family protein n=1 Tax=Sporosarcina sp. Te-1 TaxID=2818390 RepID=UPI001A9FCABD|nr:D-alanyl-D-alanine carboxypeptidase family protein [Sporosarcina sp. Te-1]QTD39956.1 D-alanyl-D-alanine carboxypeptidase [Sporosarcina sp. Te-1]